MEWELTKDDTKEHAKVEREEHMRPQPYTKNYRQLREVGNGRDILLEGRAQLFV